MKINLYSIFTCIALMLITIYSLKVNAQNVLIIYDDSPTNTNTVALKNSLIAAGYSVTMSSVSESSWNNTNPSLSGFDVAIHLNGTTYSSEMPAAGQQALASFVENDGGLYVHFEWDAYQYDQNSQMQYMVNLILFQRNSGSTSAITLTEVSSQANHPVLANVPSSFNLATCGFNVGGLRSFSSEPSTLLMTDNNSNGAVAIREFGEGCILGFHNAGNYAGYNVLSDTNLHHLIKDFIGYCGFCGVSVETNSSSVSCFGYSDGSASLSVSGGITPYTYEWNTGDTTSSLSNLSAGQYTVTVLDNGGCQTIKNVTIGSPIEITTDAHLINSVTCNGMGNGTAWVEISGGTPPFSILWTGGSTSDTATNLNGGNNIVTVTDSNGCTFNDSVFVGEPDPITPDYTITNVDCEGDMDGYISINVNGGVAPYTYYWFNGSTNWFVNNITNGVYNITITDNAGCILEDSVTLPPKFLTPTVDLGPDLNICVDWPVTIDAGNPGESYHWSTGHSSKTILVGYAGTFWVEVTNSNGCTGRDTIIVTTHTCVGINEVDNSAGVTVYPNPSSGIVKIDVFNKPLSNAKIQVYDLTGKLVISSSYTTITPDSPVTLDLSKFESGSYIIKVSNDVHLSEHRVMIQ